MIISAIFGKIDDSYFLIIFEKQLEKKTVKSDWKYFLKKIRQLKILKNTSRPVEYPFDSQNWRGSWLYIPKSLPKPVCVCFSRPIFLMQLYVEFHAKFNGHFWSPRQKFLWRKQKKPYENKEIFSCELRSLYSVNSGIQKKHAHTSSVVCVIKYQLHRYFVARRNNTSRRNQHQIVLTVTTPPIFMTIWSTPKIFGMALVQI